MREKILFLTTLMPYPIDNGGKIKTYNTLKALNEEYDIDLMCYYEDETELVFKDELKKVLVNITLFKQKITTSINKKHMLYLAFKNILTVNPVTVAKFKNNEFEKEIIKKLERSQYRYIYIDHMQIAINLNKDTLTKYKIILDQHNCEYLIMKRKCLSESNIIKKIFFLIEYIKVKKFESTLLKLATKVIILSEADKKSMNSIGDINCKCDIIPIPIDNNYCKEIVEKEGDEINLLFLGTMSWMPNYEGIIWFLDNVIPKLNKKNIKYKLYIVGKSPDKKILSYESEKVIITGYVEDINFYIGKCDVMIVPIFFGSGLRVKILEALAKGIPVISTHIGAEGIELLGEREIIYADNSEEFIEAIVKMKDINLRRKIAMNGMKIFEENYSLSALKFKILNVIKE